MARVNIVEEVSGQSNKPLSKPAHALEYVQVAHELEANLEDGLTEVEAARRLELYGKNELDEGPGVQPVQILIHQICNAMILILILAMAVSFGIGSYIEGGVISAVIFLNIAIGFYNEFKAERTMDSLRSLSSPTAYAVREGGIRSVATVTITIGDMVEVKTGDTIPGDMRLVESMNFETDEMILTGESLPIEKNSDAIFPENASAGDRLNVAFSSTTVTKGRARGIIFAVGMKSQVGSIAVSLRQQRRKVRVVKRNEDGRALPHRYAQAGLLTVFDYIGNFLGTNVGTPLQRMLAQLACGLFVVAVICAIIVLAANGFSNNQEVIIYAVATGLSMIPASLIVVLTITMAAGANVMYEKHVVVRKMNALEALGAVTDICSDKTGTLTQGKMIAKKVWLPAKGTYSVGDSGQALDPEDGDIFYSKKPPYQARNEKDEEKADSFSNLLQNNPDLQAFLNIASMANLAHVHKNGNEWKARGDPTEIAIQVFASRFNWNRERWTSGDAPQWKQIAEFPFDSDVKKMSVIFKHEQSDSAQVFTKGAVERILSSCSQMTTRDGEVVAMDEGMREDILNNMEAIAADGLRVLALAGKPWDHYTGINAKHDRADVEKDLIFHGLIGIYDPPRVESLESVQKCHQAGIKVHMLTGDHPETARAIAGQVGILPQSSSTIGEAVMNAMVMKASDFDRLSDGEIDALPMLPLVIARCSPQTKVRMIEALHRKGKFAAMTGDGVNDSPSLKRADVGIAMGQAGSDVAKDASDIILTDDNFASILNAVEEGRRMSDNIQKFILHLLAQNIAQACTLLIGLAFKDNMRTSVFPLAPVEILWVIMITSGMPDMGLGFEAAAPDIMNRPPQNGIFTLEIMIDMVVYGLWMAALCLSAFSLVLFGWGNGDLGFECNDRYSDQCDTVFRARATTFVCLTWFSLFLAWEMINMRRSFFRMQPGSKKYFTQWIHDIWANKLLFWAVVAGFATVFPTLYIPVINRKVFKHEGISWEWGIVFVESFLFFVGIESWKWAKRVYFRVQARNATGVTSNVDDEDPGVAIMEILKAQSTHITRKGTKAHVEFSKKDGDLESGNASL
ncbi:putative sodium p-type atpase protein [Botrytis fragariae]|uniref:P-type Na(+) transporter n=1 Tax=Botrytis fragariae TaxID=1964551 RepID=A0A8H6AF36_9HELO|nr:putative sodium p-type atpase protein [Botrytis fragariae]KAF5867412.1 putative sodium p-type atpase protein [Botrytis fragariae]